MNIQIINLHKSKFLQIVKELEEKIFYVIQTLTADFNLKKTQFALHEINQFKTSAELRINVNVCTYSIKQNENPNKLKSAALLNVNKMPNQNY